MQATFLVTLDIGSDTDLTGISADIDDELTQSGFTVLIVHPWARQDANTLAGGFVPPPTQQ